VNQLIPTPTPSTETPEQSLIINYRGNRLVVRAYAGTGKTFTLVRFAQANPKERFLYLAYSRAIRDEAARKFPKNVEAKTSHQLAYALFGRTYKHKLTNTIRLGDVAAAIDTRNWTQAKDVLDTVNAFLCSADNRFNYNHFARADNGKVLTATQERYQITVVEAAERLWNRMIDPQDPFPTLHDTYLKQYQLSGPDLSKRYSGILFDEAQDSNPVTSSIVLQQHCKIIMVGDRHQQIFRFRGANNSLDHPLLSNADQLYLTNSFRFGPKVALVANCLLSLKGETRPVVGLGGQDEVVMVLPHDIGHKAVIHRTVMGVIETALEQTSLGKKVFWVGGIDAYQIGNLLDAYWLSKGENDNIKNKKILKEYSNFFEYEDVGKATKDPEMMRAVKIIENYEDLDARLETLRLNTVDDDLAADITVSTAHRSKGLEFDHVQLYDDFPDLFDPELSQEAKDDEINNLYVAATRAKRILALNSSLEVVIRYVTQKQKSAQK
jgi:ATP-dependent exoDNAse (exonuclease V) beta subunit